MADCMGGGCQCARHRARVAVQALLKLPAHSACSSVGISFQLAAASALPPLSLQGRADVRFPQCHLALGARGLSSIQNSTKLARACPRIITQCLHLSLHPLFALKLVVASPGLIPFRLSQFRVFCRPPFRLRWDLRHHCNPLPGEPHVTPPRSASNVQGGPFKCARGALGRNALLCTLGVQASHRFQ